VVGLINRQFNLTDSYTVLPTSKIKIINCTSPLSCDDARNTANFNLTSYSTTAKNDGKYLKLDGKSLR
jgi:hypothetical protein